MTWLSGRVEKGDWEVAQLLVPAAAASTKRLQLATHPLLFLCVEAQWQWAESSSVSFSASVFEAAQWAQEGVPVW